jgi:hypothetical protein
MTTDAIRIDSLTDADLRELLGGWNPDTGGNDQRPLLLAAAKNRHGEFLPIDEEQAA